MRKFLSKKVLIIGGIAAAVSVGLGGVAAAYFTATASNTSAYVQVGSAGWSITDVSTSGGPLYPGAGTETLTFNLNNTSGGEQLLTSVVVAATEDNSGGVLDLNSNTNVDGCQASWFTATEVSGPGGGEYASGYVGSYDFTIAMTDSGNQTPCANLAPQLTINVT